MASSKDYLQFVLEQLSELQDIFMIKEIVPHFMIFGNPKGGKVKK